MYQTREKVGAAYDEAKVGTPHFMFQDSFTWLCVWGADWALLTRKQSWAILTPLSVCSAVLSFMLASEDWG